MANNPVGFTIGSALSNDNCIKGADFDDVFVRSDCFNSGGLFLWGNNTCGQLGANNTTNASTPQQVITGGTNWKDVELGSLHTIAIKEDGTIWTWGLNSSGQLGDNTIISKSSPVQVSGTDWKKITAGSAHTAVIKNNGGLYSWGLNTQGQLGTNDVLQRNTPIQVISGGVWSCLSAGENHTAAIKNDGTLWSWGLNNHGQLGTFNYQSQSSPVQTYSGGTNWKQISAAGAFTAAVKTDGTLWAWGLNSCGQIGNGNNLEQLTPTQTGCNFTDWRKVSLGYSTTIAQKSDGTLWSWGTQSCGVGGCSTNTPSKISDSSYRCAEAGGSACYPMSGIVSSDGYLYIKSANANGEVGNNSTTLVSTYTQTGTKNDWVKIKFGSNFSAGIRCNSW